MKNASLERNIYVSRDLIQWKDKGKSNTIYIHAFLGGRPVFSHDHLLTILFLFILVRFETVMGYQACKLPEFWIALNIIWLFWNLIWLKYVWTITIIFFDGDPWLILECSQVFRRKFLLVVLLVPLNTLFTNWHPIPPQQIIKHTTFENWRNK